jgi:ATP-dependent DNA ligase
VPLLERRAILAACSSARRPPSDPLHENFDADVEQLLQNACRCVLEGMIGKRAIRRMSPSAAPPGSSSSAPIARSS